ncbi:hypothetical protein HBZS_119210 [Helicobacter bizzozeronii CCUG 35545]|nr:hypothetical protein HBZS_119210 [Helicobacter bizzozeronii CCUG 35545]
MEPSFLTPLQTLKHRPSVFKVLGIKKGLKAMPNFSSKIFAP